MSEPTYWVTGGHCYHTADCRVLPSCVTQNEWTRQEIANGRRAGKNLAFRTPLTACRICAPDSIPRATLRASEQVQYDDGSWSRETVPALSLTDFLLARIAEDVEAATPGEGWNEVGPDYDVSVQFWDYGEVHVGHKRFLAECEAKRRIVESAREPFVVHGGEIWHPSELCFLAEIYADHADYDEGWKP